MLGLLWQANVEPKPKGCPQDLEFNSSTPILQCSLSHSATNTINILMQRFLGAMQVSWVQSQ